MPRWSRFRRLFGPEPKADVDAELSFHVEMRVRELIEQGVPPERARTLALQRFGDYDSSRAACVEISKRRGRRVARREYLTELRQDAVYALRMLRRAPGFTIVALTTLALGIGANSAIFSVVQGVLLAPLPFRDAERLYRVTTLYPDGSPYSLSAPDFMSVREQTRTFDQVEAFSGGVYTMLGAGEPREVRGTNVSDGLLSLLGLPVTVGRAVTARRRINPDTTESRCSTTDSGSVSSAAIAAVLGRTVSIAGTQVEIVGVLAPDAHLLDEADVYCPLAYGETFTRRRRRSGEASSSTVIARAKRESTPRIADDLQRIGTQLQTAFPETNDTLTFTRSVCPRHDARRSAHAAPRAAWRRRIRVARRLRQRREPAARAGIVAAGGAGRSIGARRWTRPVVAPAPHRGRRPRRRRRRHSAWRRLLATRALVAATARRYPPPRRVGLNGAVVAVTFAARARDEPGLRHSSGAAGFSGNRLPSALRTARAAVPAAVAHRMRVGARRRRDGARGRAAHRRRPADSELHRVDAGRSRLPRRASPVISRDAAEREIQGGRADRGFASPSSKSVCGRCRE